MARRWLWAQGEERRSVTGVDELIDLCQRCWITDIMFLAWHSGGALWNSAYFTPSYVRIDDYARGISNMHYMDYLVSRGNEVGINVHAWLTIGGYPWQWQFRSAGLPWNWDASAAISGWYWGSWLNMSLSDVQQAVGSASYDVVTQISGIAGVHLDYIRVPDGASGGGITSSHVSSCVANAHAATSTAGVELTAAVVPHKLPGWDINWVNQQWPTWLNGGYLDEALPMLYYTASTIQNQIYYIETESPTVYNNVTCGIAPASPQGSFYTLGQWVDILDTVIYNGYDMAIFDDSWLYSSYQPALEDRPLSAETPTTYYIDSVGGSDSNGGESSGDAWQNLTKIYDVTLRPGDYIYLKCGSDWDFTSVDAGGWKIEGSGTADDPIRIQQYDTGNDPIIRNDDTYGSDAICMTINGDYVYVDGIKFTDAAYAGVLVNARTRWRIDNCEITNVGIAVSVYVSTYGRVYNCNIHDLVAVVNDAFPTANDWGAIGVYMTSASNNNSVTYCTFTNCSSTSFDWGYMGGAIYISGSNGTGSDNNLFAYNYATGCYRFIYGSGDHDRNVIHHNISLDNSYFMEYALQSGNPTNFDIENNTIVENSPTDTILVWSIGTPDTGTQFRNNIIWSNGQRITNADGFGHTYNLYYRVDSSSLGLTLGTGEIQNNPYFVDQPGDDFHLTGSSPAIDSGTNLGYSQDYEGNAIPQGSAPDMGAYEATVTSGGLCIIVYTAVTVVVAMQETS